MKRLVAGAGVIAVVLLAWAGPASAHASLESTVPAAGEQVDEPPAEVVLTFSEGVEASLGAVRVYDSNADRVDAGGAHHPDGHGDEVAQALPADLSDGSYVVTWRVVSDDGHPVHGAFTFQVGDVATGDTAALARRLLAADGGSSTVGGLYAVVRFAVFASLILLVGAAAFCLVAWPEGLGVGRARRLLWSAWGVAVAATVVSIGVEGAYVGALPLADVLDPDVASSVLDTRFGRVALLRLALLVAVGGLLLAQRHRTEGAAPPSPLQRVALAVVGVALLVTPGLGGHASSGRLVPFALATDVVHLGAAALWLGGLTVLLAIVLPRRQPAELAQVVPRFSALAFAAVAALVVTGSFQAWRQVGSLEALRSTTYGRLLSVKLALFAVMVAFGYLGRRWVQRGYPAVGGDAVARDDTTDGDTEADRVDGDVDGDVEGDGKGDDEEDGATVEPIDPEVVVAGYRRSIRVETAVGVAILAVTALLVNAQPARSALAQPYSAELVADDLLVDLTIDPAKAGPTEIHVYTLTSTGAVADVEGLTVELTLPSEDIGPLEVPLERAGPGHFSAYDYDLPIAGEWEVEVKALVDQFTEVTASDTVTVRGG